MGSLRDLFVQSKMRLFAIWLAQAMGGRRVKRSDRFRAGDRIVLSGKALAAQGLASREAGRVWTVKKCSCELCVSRRFVAVDQIVKGYGVRHIARSNIRHHGQPMTSELSPGHTQDLQLALAKGLRDKSVFAKAFGRK